MMNPAQNPRLPLSAAEEAIDDMLADAFSLVNMETYSFDKPGLEGLLEGLLGVVDKRLGAPDEQERFSGGEYGDIVVRTYRGTTPGRVVITGHYDTVWPAGTVAAWNPPPHEDPRERLSGPGLFDMKIGLTQGIWRLNCFVERASPTQTSPIFSTATRKSARLPPNTSLRMSLAARMPHSFWKPAWTAT